MSSNSNSFTDNLILSFFNKPTEPKARLRLRMLLFKQKPSEIIEEITQNLLNELHCVDYIVALD